MLFWLAFDAFRLCLYLQTFSGEIEAGGWGGITADPHCLFWLLSVHDYSEEAGFGFMQCVPYGLIMQTLVYFFNERKCF